MDAAFKLRNVGEISEEDYDHMEERYRALKIEGKE